MEINHKYKWELSAESWYIRFYLWFYEASPRDVNFCKLFWAYLLLPILFPLKMLVALPLFALFDKFDRWATRRRRDRIERLGSIVTPVAPPEPKGPSWTMRALNKVADWAIRTNIWMRNQWSWFRYVALALLVAWLVAAFGLAGYFLVTNLDVIWDFLPTALTIIGIAAGCATLVALSYAALVYFNIPEWINKRWYNRKRRPGTSFFKVMKIGYVAVKSNTCPQVTLKEYPVKPSVSEETA